MIPYGQGFPGSARLLLALAVLGALAALLGFAAVLWVLTAAGRPRDLPGPGATASQRRAQAAARDRLAARCGRGWRTLR